MTCSSCHSKHAPSGPLRGHSSPWPRGSRGHESGRQVFCARERTRPTHSLSARTGPALRTHRRERAPHTASAPARGPIRGAGVQICGKGAPMRDPLKKRWRHINVFSCDCPDWEGLCRRFGHSARSARPAHDRNRRPPWRLRRALCAARPEPCAPRRPPPSAAPGTGAVLRKAEAPSHDRYFVEFPHNHGDF